MSKHSVLFCIGALGRNRTGTELPPTDFKSAASTCSATSASQSTFINAYFYNCNINLVFLFKICFDKGVLKLTKIRQEQRFGIFFMKGLTMDKVDISLQRYIFPNINSDGWRFISIFAAVTALLAIIWLPLGIIGIVLTIWCYYFFRDPERVTPQLENVVVAPADGIVQMISRVTGPEELGLNTKTFNRISIFMSVFNVHVNRAPANGKILQRAYIKGKFFNATLDKASKDNERMLLSMRTDSGKEIAFVQIAGLIARRIICNAKDGQEYKAGERFGHIRFGSRLDVYLPTDTEVLVSAGQTMVAGETVLARLGNGSTK